ncbi:MAG TPA: cupin domain-containing protein [Ktedonobacterales bacterium]|jgi:mannose-6-phosphate isomerase-like protein (cupin superfamily)
MSESSSESSSAGAQERRLDQIVVAPLAGLTIGSAGTQFIIAEWSDPGLPPGSPPDPPRPIAPLHVHHGDDEAWYVLEGALAFQLGDQIVEVEAGGAAFAPRGVAHTYWNPRQERARYLLVMTPTIRALIADLHVTDDRSPEATRAIYQRHRSELLASG